jgi:hypothetical protein
VCATVTRARQRPSGLDGELLSSSELQIAQDLLVAFPWIYIGAMSLSLDEVIHSSVRQVP